jgi:hypothetical protein
MFSRFFHRSCAAIAGIALCGGAALVGLAATGGTAYAQSYTTLNATSSFMAIDVSGASTAPGAPIIQWYDDGGANQHWYVPGMGAKGLVWNQNSGMCLTTDGVEGDQLFQWYCDPNSLNEQWSVGEKWTPYGDEIDLYNSAYALVVDVYGNSYSAGAAIDAWPYDWGYNQAFFEDGAN